MLCSIITVSKDNLSDVKYTLDSIITDNKLVNNCECLIIDDSKDEKIAKYIENLNIQGLNYHRGDSKNLYSAMNIGIKKSTGQFLWFLNSGDKRSDDFNIQSLEFLKADLIYGNTRYTKNGLVYSEVSKPCFNLSELNQIKNSLPCHQSIIFRADFIRQNRIVYDDKLSISGDYQFISDCVHKFASIYYQPVYISDFTLGGASNFYRNLSAAIQHGKEISLTRNMSHFSTLKIKIKICIKYILAKFY